MCIKTQNKDQNQKDQENPTYSEIHLNLKNRLNYNSE